MKKMILLSMAAIIFGVHAIILMKGIVPANHGTFAVAVFCSCLIIWAFEKDTMDGDFDE
jgi:hypothetical protein